LRKKEEEFLERVEAFMHISIIKEKQLAPRGCGYPIKVNILRLRYTRSCNESIYGR
jgi:hypothetical protein